MIEPLRGRERARTLSGAERASDTVLASTMRELEAVQELDGTIFVPTGPVMTEAARRLAASMRVILDAVKAALAASSTRARH